jgi:predicted DNA-binding transcriptional regulator YafY
MTALSTAGIPVYCERGPGGGIALVESYRTDLTGLSSSEVRALFMLSIPAPLDELGVSQELKSALLKLSTALPDSRQKEEHNVRQRIHLDSSWWFQSNQPVPHLPELQQALWQDRKLKISYRTSFNFEVKRVVCPYGLVAKANVWYLVYGWEGIWDASPVADLVQAKCLNEVFARPPDFDLPRFWERWCRAYEQNRPSFTARVRISPPLARWLLITENKEPLREQLQSAFKQDPPLWVEVTLEFENFDAARQKILGWGSAAEVLSPLALRQSVLDFAKQTVGRYLGIKVDDFITADE